MGRPYSGCIISLWPFVDKIKPIARFFVLNRLGLVKKSEYIRIYNEYLELLILKLLEDQFLVTVEISLDKRFRFKTTDTVEFINSISTSIPEYEILFSECLEMVRMHDFPDFVRVDIIGHDIVITWKND